MRWLWVQVFIACVFAPTAASGVEERLQLIWQAPPGCPSAEEVRRAALSHVESQRPAPPEDALRAKALVERQDTPSGQARFRVVLEVGRGTTTGERVIEADTCQGVAEATAVVLSLALVSPAAAPMAPGPAEAPGTDREGTFPLPSAPTDTTEEPPAAPDVDHAGGAPSAPAKVDDAARTPSPPSVTPRPAPHPAEPRLPGSSVLAVGAQGAMDAGTLPAWSLGGSLVLAWTPRRARVEVDARRWAPRSQNVGESTAGARFAMTSVGARACYVLWREGAVDLSPCGGGDAHWVTARGYGADTNHDVTVRWVSLAAGVLGRASLNPWLALRGRLETFAPLSRPTFVVERMGEVHRAAPLGIAATFGAEVFFF